MTELRTQLAPSWSGVNIALTVVLFIVAWPLGLAMVAYVIWGRQAGLDLGQPDSFVRFGSRLADAWRAGMRAWRDSALTPQARTEAPVDAPVDDAGGRPDIETAQSEGDAPTPEPEHVEAGKRQRSEQQGHEQKVEKTD